jgi:integrase
VTNVRGEKKYRDDVIGLQEFREMLGRSQRPGKHPYYRRRDQAVLCVLWLTGKRASEVASIQLRYVNPARDTLDISFMVGKKRTVKRYSTRTKAIPLNDPYVGPVLEYYDHMVDNHPECMHLFPSTRYSNLRHTVKLNPEKHLSRATVWRIVVSAGEETWPHLFRETVGARVARYHGDTINGLFAVKRRLDLERLDTAMRYVERYATEKLDLSAPRDLAASEEPLIREN